MFMDYDNPQYMESRFISSSVQASTNTWVLETAKVLLGLEDLLIK
jgi:hypothetical protein